MTINNLYKILGKLIEQGEGRRQVHVDKSSFYHALESDGVVVLPVKSVLVRAVPLLDDDGGVKELANGMEAHRVCMIMHGGHYTETGTGE